MNDALQGTIHTNIPSYRKEGIFEIGSFHKSPLSRDSGEFRDLRDLRDLRDCRGDWKTRIIRPFPREFRDFLRFLQ